MLKKGHMGDVAWRDVIDGDEHLWSYVACRYQIWARRQDGIVLKKQKRFVLYCLSLTVSSTASNDDVQVGVTLQWCGLLRGSVDAGAVMGVAKHDEVCYLEDEIGMWFEMK